MRRKHAYACIAAACSAARERGLFSGAGGNVSLRAGDVCFITCSGVAKGRLRPEDVTAARLDGAERAKEAVGCRPSSELGMHLALYRARPEVAAVVHAHPPHLLALSLCVPWEDFLRLPLYETERLRERLRPVPALPPGSVELARAAAEAAADPGIDALWLERHGLVCLGGHVFSALTLAEELEQSATVQLLTRK